MRIAALETVPVHSVLFLCDGIRHLAPDFSIEGPLQARPVRFVRTDCVRVILCNVIYEISYETKNETSDETTCGYEDQERQQRHHFREVWMTLRTRLFDVPMQETWTSIFSKKGHKRTARSKSKVLVQELRSI